MDDQRFELTAEHVTLLRAMYVGWQDDEFGAPEIDPKRPYGNSNVPRDIYEALGDGEWDDDHGMPAGLSPREWSELNERYGVLHRQTQTALQIVLATGSFDLGVHVAPAYSMDWRRLDHCERCRHAPHEPGRCRADVGTGYMGAVPCQCGVSNG